MAQPQAQKPINPPINQPAPPSMPAPRIPDAAIQSKIAAQNPGLPLSIPNEMDLDIPEFLTTTGIMKDANVSQTELISEDIAKVTGSETLEELQRMLVIAQLRNANMDFMVKSREENKLAENQAMLKRARDQNIADIRKQVLKKAAERDACPHQKPNNRGSAIAGTRDHQGHYHFLCQYCQKEWTDNELPAVLRIDGDFIGGPTVGALVF